MLSKLVKILILLYISIKVECNDLMVGRATPYSQKIYSAIKEANPAFWTRRDDIMINAPYHDFISAVYVTDLRPDKDGEAYIEAGGIGSKTVTIAFKSPSVLRGYKFAIDVYAENSHEYYIQYRTPYNGFRGVGVYANSYPVNSATYPMNSATYPVSGAVYPVGNVQAPLSGGYPQYPYGR